MSVAGQCFGGVIVPILYTSELFSMLENKLIGYADDSTLIAVVSFPGVRVIVAEYPSGDLVKVSEWCDLCGMKLNARRTKTAIVFRSRTMHLQSPALTICRTVLKESDNLVILGVTFDSKMIFEKHLLSVSRAAFQPLGILRKSWQLYSMIECFLRDSLTVLTCQFWSTVLRCGARLPIHILNYWTV